MINAVLAMAALGAGWIGWILYNEGKRMNSYWQRKSMRNSVVAWQVAAALMTVSNIIILTRK
ncbi:hypothetical protein [Anaerotalea alkaliphila]|uniref:Uncharacterized protein n=1 Tax=Anaerotalea alkaliphila TaxID=2662126 RepID=A0A7X5HXU1_9FIRM|nr:hypothetical protein [Anaerotalea alkaliphila]NDL68501.1 hypothetical protein [Anaerotalea alkaliphila]